MSQLLAFLKPDAVLRKNIGVKVLSELASDSKLTIQSFQKCDLDEELTGEHYFHVKTRPFYRWLIKYVTSSPIYVMLVETNGGDEVVTHLRDLLGHTLSHVAAPGTVRNRYGIYAGVNCLHMSDSLESGEHEVSLWKKHLGIREGQFDMSVSDYLELYDNNIPDNTLSIRELCIQIAKNGSAGERIINKISGLLSLECPNASKKELENIISTVIDSCFWCENVV